MGKEMEWKLAVPEAGLLDEILAWEGIRARMAEEPRFYHMRSAYYDAPDRRFSGRRITLRRRMENETSVICVKAPLPGADNRFLHGEWELEGTDLAAALPRLVELGAPEVLLEPVELDCLWRADFERRAVLLRFEDGSAAELALDRGALYGPTRSMPFCELELEQKEGGPAGTLALLTALRERFALEPQEKSKYARARALD